MNDIGAIGANAVNVAGTLAITGVAANMINHQAKNMGRSSPKKVYKAKTQSKKIFSPKSSKGGKLFSGKKSKNSIF